MLLENFNNTIEPSPCVMAYAVERECDMRRILVVLVIALSMISCSACGKSQGDNGTVLLSPFCITKTVRINLTVFLLK